MVAAVSMMAVAVLMVLVKDGGVREARPVTSWQVRAEGS